MVAASLATLNCTLKLAPSAKLISCPFVSVSPLYVIVLIVTPVGEVTEKVAFPTWLLTGPVVELAAFSAAAASSSNLAPPSPCGVPNGEMIELSGTGIVKPNFISDGR